ncbi:response regulator [Streptococcus sp. zg-86]|uniref:Response regulator n=1 Tax=Streptococcus zhangguiae TaxID=2664091 RepID=A0A6I4RAT6_9STRE|nr:MULTISPECIES: response regulator transcription factor [unclassified Streptococcus]MTB63796.1 response regulator [Streptococcus sp. zg-86]MTB90106.1 response regulator [Streptococcus sp. zg-36]MWV55778.1 response regulator [Streptococcus sp. zg-70]QTH47936.1 response regulator transcription factor [Streptococcus sp. zg-86]
MYKILVIDDDLEILKLIRTILEMKNFSVTTRQEVSLPIDPKAFKGFDLILLDVMLQQTDGLAICRAIRQEVDTPIVFVSARDTEEDIVKGLQLGGDDYITKPFGVKQLSAKVEAHLRREVRTRQAQDRYEQVVRELGAVSFFLEEKQVSIRGQVLPLTQREYAILELLSRYPQKVFTREEIYEQVYDEEADALFHSISEYIYQIRTKFAPHGVNPIKTIRGIGYQYADDTLLH